LDAVLGWKVLGLSTLFAAEEGLVPVRMRKEFQFHFKTDINFPGSSSRRVEPVAVNYGTLSIWRPGTWQACAHYLVVNEHGEG
jgi:hypothetical protein